MIATSKRGSGDKCFLSSNKFHRVVDLGAPSTATIDFNRGSVFKCDTPSSGGLTVATANLAEGQQAALHVDEVNSANKTLTFPAAWVWITAKPSQINSGLKGVLAIECFDSTNVIAAWKAKVQ